MAKREKKQVVSGISEAQYLEALSAYAHNDAEAESIVAKLNMLMTKIRERYDPKLTKLLAERERQMGIVMAYCTENKAVLFAEKRSLETAHGKVGFRFGTPKLKTLPKWTWEKVLTQVELLLPDYVRTKKEVDKEALLTDRTDEKVAPYLNTVGVYVDKDESFFIELKKEEATAVAG